MRILPMWATTVLPILLLPAAFAGCPGNDPSNPHPGLESKGGTATPPAALPYNFPVTHNDMTHNELARSALMTLPSAFGLLTTQPLDDQTMAKMPDSTFDLKNVDEAGAPIGEYSRTLMQYIVSCALDYDASVKYVAPGGTDGGNVSWSGELGLCGAKSPAGSWADATPTNQCLQLVSACLLARVNAYKLRVPLSIRGKPAGLFPLRDRVPVETMYREEGASIASFDACTGGAPGGVGQNCGFEPQFVGRCAEGSTVTVALEGAGPNDFAPTVRVCNGIYGCDTPDVPVPDARYACNEGVGFIGEANEGAASPWKVEFPCPANGPPGYGYYSVMTAALEPGIEVAASDTPDNHYPATEAEVFTYREGTFYGNLFEGVVRTQSASETPFPFGDAFACYSDIWTAGFDHVEDRACAGTPKCFDTAPRACEASSVPDAAKFFDDDSYACLTGYDLESDEHDGEQRSYGLCKGTPSDTDYWELGITVYLNGPCDMTGEGPYDCGSTPKGCALH